MKSTLTFISFFLFFTAWNQILQPDSLGIAGKGLKYSDAVLFNCDNDNDLDLVISGSNNTASYTTVYKFNSENQRFIGNYDYSLPPISFSDLSYADIDKDGDIDLFTSGTWESYNFVTDIYLNDGQCQFSKSNNNFIGVTGGESQFFDADQDGDPDLIYVGRSNSNTDKALLYLNDGNGNFSLSSINSFYPIENGSVDLADVNLDGKIDLLISGRNIAYNSETTKLYINMGGGVFNEDVSQLFIGQSFGSANFTDINTDGHIDIFVMGLHNGVGTINKKFYLNDGTGQFLDAGDRGILEVKMNLVDFSDIDLDGDQDVFVSGSTINNIDSCGIYYNNNGYFFRDTTFNSQPVNNGCSVFGDVDGKCGEELFYFGMYQIPTCYNYSSNFYLNKTTVNCGNTNDTIIIVNPSAPKDKFYPNPVAEQLSIKSFNPITFYKIIDLRGKIIQEVNFEEQLIIEIDFSFLDNGLYNIVYGDANTIQNLKIIRSSVPK